MQVGSRRIGQGAIDEQRAVRGTCRAPEVTMLGTEPCAPRSRHAFAVVLLTVTLAAAPPRPVEAGPINLPRAAGGITHFDRNLPLPGVVGGTFFELLPALGLGPIIGAPLPAINFGTPFGSFLDNRFPCPAFVVPGTGAGEICKFSDFVFSPLFYHFEFELQNPNLGFTLPYNVIFFTPEGISGGRVRAMAPGEVYFFDVVTNDALVPVFPEVGGRLWWMFSRLPFAIAATSSIKEGGLYPPPLFACPVVAPGALCGGVAGFSPPTTDMWDGPIDPSLPGFAFLDPADLPAMLPLVEDQPRTPGLDHFQCYEIKPSSFVGPTVSLHDEFGSVGGVFVQRPERLCAPADKNDEDPGAVSDPDHLVGYRIRHAFAGAPNRTVTNQFGSIQLDIAKPEQLMVPSAKGLTSPPPPLGSATIDHFQCYKVRRPRRSPRFIPIPGVKIDDQFGTATVTLKRPYRLCSPVDKNGEDPGADLQPMHLLCYKTTRVPFPTQGVFLDNQFGQSTTTLITRTEFCVPSVASETPMTTTTSVTTTSTSSTSSTTTQGGCVGTTFHDETFMDADWTLQAFTYGGGGSTTGAQVLAGGCGGTPGRRVFVKIGPLTVAGAAVFGVHINNTATYNPSSGSISSLAYSENDKFLAADSAPNQATGPAIEQNGAFYVYQPPLTAGSNPGCAPASITSAGANDFCLMLPSGSNPSTYGPYVDCTQHPDFSCTGPPLSFGFFRANSSPPPPNPGTRFTDHVIDDWNINLCQVPCP